MTTNPGAVDQNDAAIPADPASPAAPASSADHAPSAAPTSPPDGASPSVPEPSPRPAAHPGTRLRRVPVWAVVLAALVTVAVGGVALSRFDVPSGPDGGQGGGVISSPTPAAASEAARPALPGRTYYMAPNGRDAADGSLVRPRRTFLGASRLLKPGDTLVVRGGTYRDPGGYNWSADASGTSAAPITVRPYPGEQPVFEETSGQPALILQDVSWVTIEGLSFTGVVPHENGVILLLRDRHVTLDGIRSSGYRTDGPTDSNLDHHVYLVGSSDVLIQGSTLEDIPGAAVHIYGSEPSARVTVRSNVMSDNGTGILAGSGLAGATFVDNVISAGQYGFHFNSSSRDVEVAGNRVTAPVGIWTEQLVDDGPASEHDNCFESSEPFRVGWPGTGWSLAQWQLSGRGSGTTVGACS